MPERALEFIQQQQAAEAAAEQFKMASEREKRAKTSAIDGLVNALLSALRQHLVAADNEAGVGALSAPPGCKRSCHATVHVPPHPLHWIGSLLHAARHGRIRVPHDASGRVRRRGCTDLPGAVRIHGVPAR